jgi:hypothetical protein
MASTNAFYGQPTTFDETMFFYGLVTVVGAGWVKTAARRQAG